MTMESQRVAYCYVIDGGECFVEFFWRKGCAGKGGYITLNGAPQKGLRGLSRGQIDDAVATISANKTSCMSAIRQAVRAASGDTM